MKKRNTNHLLYESYLDKKGRIYLYEKTKDMSLGAIVTFTKVRPMVNSNEPKEVMNTIRLLNGLNELTSVADLDYKQLSEVEAVIALAEMVSDDDAQVLEEVIDSIDNYWNERKAAN